MAPHPVPQRGLPSDYGEVLSRLKEQTRSAQLRAHRAVKTELIKLYWFIGKTILGRQEAEGWGAGVINNLADDLRREFPEMRGLSRRNLHYMRAFADAWPEIVQQAAAQLPWGHIMVLLDRVAVQATREWYAAEAVRNGWSRAVLLNMVKSQLHLRAGAAPSNFADVLAPADSELVEQLVLAATLTGAGRCGSRFSAFQTGREEPTTTSPRRSSISSTTMSDSPQHRVRQTTTVVHRQDCLFIAACAAVTMVGHLAPTVDAQSASAVVRSPVIREEPLDSGGGRYPVGLLRCVGSGHRPVTHLCGEPPGHLIPYHSAGTHLYRSWSRTSIASRSPSPTMLTATIVSRIIAAAGYTSHQYPS